MKNFKAIALLIALIAISNISAALKPKEQKEYNALLATIKNNKPLNSAQKKVALKYKDLLAKDAPNVNISKLGQTTVAQKKAAPTKKAAPIKKAAPTKKAAPIKKATPVKKTIAKISVKQPAAIKKEVEMRAQPQVVQVQVKRVRPVGIEIPKGATVATESDIYDRAASIFYDAAGETLKESGLRKYVEMVRQAYPTLNILELIKKTYDDATTILDPVMPGTQEGNDLYNRLCNDISYTLNRMTPTLIAR